MAGLRPGHWASSLFVLDFLLILVDFLLILVIGGVEPSGVTGIGA
jgi:hypothetical protein